MARTAVDPATGNANFITHDERAALEYLAKDPVAGGVLTQFYLGEAVPGRTGRQTFVGDCLWSEPDCMPRSEAADALFGGHDTKPQARAFVKQSGARFMLASCSAQDVGLRRTLKLIVAVTHFGCATVYQLAPATARAVLWQNYPAMRLFALRGANSVEANEESAILDATEPADPRADGSQLAGARRDGELHLHAHPRPRRRVPGAWPRASSGWTPSRCCAPARFRCPGRCPG